MPNAALKLRPGVNAEFTETLNEAGISTANMIRFKAGLPQKRGGWSKYFPFAMDGVPKALLAWQDLNAIGRLAVGATEQLSVIANGTQTDITPQELLSDFAEDFTTTNLSTTVEVTDPNIANLTTFDSVFFNTPIAVGGVILSGLYPIDTITGADSYTITAGTAATSSVSNGGAVPEFTTAANSATVSVALVAHGLSVGGSVVFPIPTTVGGIIIDGTYLVTAVGSADAFSITASAEASSTATVAMNGGDAQLLYYIGLGPSATGSGYGLGGYGLGGYGTGVVPPVQTGDPITATDWSTTNWGEILLANPGGGGIYFWRPRSGFQNAIVVPTAPVFNGGIFIAMPIQILVAWGSTVTQDIGVQQDPLMIRWSDAEDFTNWTVSAITQAGSFRIPEGSEIRGGLQGPQQALIWTDLDLWSMRYLGATLAFGFDKLSSGCGLVGPHAATVMGSTVYWMSNGNFFQLSGNEVRVIPCSIWDLVFQDLDTANAHKCVAAANSAFNEVEFFYPSQSGGTGECDKSAKFNILEGAWDPNVLPRSAWIDESVLGQPIGTTPSGIIYQHEVSPNADGAPLSWYFETGYFVINEGQDIPFVDQFYPDMKYGEAGGDQNATVLVTIEYVSYPSGAVKTRGPYTTTSAKLYVNTRLRGRQIKLRFEGNDLNSFARLGNPRFRFAPDGRR